MIKSHRASLASTISAFALLGWLAIDQAPAYADAAASSGYVDDAVKRLEQRDPQAAIIQLRNALQADPNNLRARQLLGEIYLNAGRFADAEKELMRVHEKAPSGANTISLAQAFLGQGKADDVLPLIDDVGGDTDPELMQDITLLRVEALLNLERLTDARKALSAELDANPLDADVNIMDARISLAEGDPDSARAKIERALDVDQNSLHGWLLDAQIKSGGGLNEQALASLDRASSLAPGDGRIKVMRAEILIRRAKFEDAEQVVTEVLQQSPGDVAANFLLATIQSNKGELVEADATLRKIADVARDVDEVMLLSGVVKLGIDQHAQAETLLAKYVARRPDNLAVRRLLAGLQLKRGNTRAAADTLQPVAGANSTDVISLQLMSSAQLRTGDIDDARVSLNRLAELGQKPSAQQAAALLSVLNSSGERIPSDQAKLVMANILDQIRNGEGEDAKAAAKELVNAHPQNPIALNLLGMTELVNASDEQTARDLFERAISHDPSYIDAHKNLDRLDIQAADFDRLQQRLEQRIKDGLDVEGTGLQLAQLHVSQKRPDQGFKVLADQAAVLPKSVLLRRALLALAVQQERKNEATKVTEELLALGDAGDPVAYSAAGDHFFNAGDFDAAVFAYTKLNQAKPDQPMLLVALAQSQYRAGDIKGARASLLHIRSLQPTHVIANNSLVDLDLESGRIDDALAFSDELKDAAPDQAARLKSKILRQADKPEEALAVLEQALAANPSPVVSHELFRMRRALDRHDEAIAGLKSWIATNPDDVGALDMMGDAHVERRELEAALPYFERAHRLTLNDPVLLNDLSWVRHALGRPGAEDLARRAYQMRPTPAIGDTLGWILVQKGNTEQGLRLLREAYQGLQDNPDIRYHLAYALHSSGEANAAKELLLELEKWPQPFMEQDKALELLDALKSS
ncbi:MAG: XrtA/PEP-CTERM system TPR-repeat protein PrsT [Geminicoccaceae bacterium]